MAGALLIILPALGVAWFVNSSGSAHEALVMASTVDAGQVVTREDLTVTDLPNDSSLSSLRPDQGELVIGRRAATDLPAGAVLNEGSTVTELTPPAGQSVVGVLLAPAQMPQDVIGSGDLVRLVDVPGNDAVLSQEAPASIAGTVVSLGAPDTNGAVVVNVRVDTDQAPLLASHAAINRITLVLDPRTN